MLASTGREAYAGGRFRWSRSAPLRFSTECRGREHKQPNRTQPTPALSYKTGEPEGAKEAGANCARELVAGRGRTSPRHNDCDNNSGVPSPTQALRTASVGSCRLRAAQCLTAFCHRRSRTWVEQLGHSGSVGFPRPPRRDDACGSHWAVNRQLLGSCRCASMSATSTTLARKPGPRRQRCRDALLSAGGCHQPSAGDSILASLPPTPMHQG